MGRPRTKFSLSQGFWDRVQIGCPDECWPWTAGRSKCGYGAWKFLGVMYKAHRVAWELTNGDIPDGMLACHHCDNPSCCNPNHLFIGTHDDNMKDKTRKLRGVWGEKQHSAKLNPEKVRSIRASIGIPQVDLARQYGVEQNTISRVIRRETWRNVE